MPSSCVQKPLSERQPRAAKSLARSTGHARTTGVGSSSNNDAATCARVSALAAAPSRTAVGEACDGALSTRGASDTTSVVIAAASALRAGMVGAANSAWSRASSSPKPSAARGRINRLSAHRRIDAKPQRTMVKQTLRHLGLHRRYGGCSSERVVRIAVIKQPLGWRPRLGRGRRACASAWLTLGYTRSSAHSVNVGLLWLCAACSGRNSTVVVAARVVEQRLLGCRQSSSCRVRRRGARFEECAAIIIVVVREERLRVARSWRRGSATWFGRLARGAEGGWRIRVSK